MASSDRLCVSVHCHKTALMKLSMQHDGKFLLASSQVLTIDILMYIQINCGKTNTIKLDGFHLYFSYWLLLFGYFCFHYFEWLPYTMQMHSKIHHWFSPLFAKALMKTYVNTDFFNEDSIPFTKCVTWKIKCFILLKTNIWKNISLDTKLWSSQGILIIYLWILKSMHKYWKKILMNALQHYMTIIKLMLSKHIL